MKTIDPEIRGLTLICNNQNSDPFMRGGGDKFYTLEELKWDKNPIKN